MPRQGKYEPDVKHGKGRRRNQTELSILRRILRKQCTKQATQTFMKYITYTTQPTGLENFLLYPPTNGLKYGPLPPWKSDYWLRQRSRSLGLG